MYNTNTTETLIWKVRNLFLTQLSKSSTETTTSFFFVYLTPGLFVPKAKFVHIGPSPFVWMHLGRSVCHIKHGNVIKKLMVFFIFLYPNITCYTGSKPFAGWWVNNSFFSKIQWPIKLVNCKSLKIFFYGWGFLIRVPET